MNRLQKRYQYLAHFKKAVRKGNYPIGTIAYYGPNDQIVTKIVAAVLIDDKRDPIIKNWVGDGIVEDQVIANEIGEFFRAQKVQNIIMTEGIIGCPHEEGIDYPSGESCPNCPFWSDSKTETT
jgi:hypothetical protein